MTCQGHLPVPPRAAPPPSAAPPLPPAAGGKAAAFTLDVGEEEQIKSSVKAAIAQFGKLHISGFLAWLMWLFLHVFFLIGFRNRFAVMFEWFWAYLTRERGLATAAAAARVVIEWPKPPLGSQFPARANQNCGTDGH